LWVTDGANVSDIGTILLLVVWCSALRQIRP